METYVIWDEDEQGFFEMTMEGMNVFTIEASSACHYRSLKDASVASSRLENPIILKWM